MKDKKSVKDKSVEVYVMAGEEFVESWLLTLEEASGLSKDLRRAVRQMKESGRTKVVTLEANASGYVKANL